MMISSLPPSFDLSVNAAASGPNSTPNEVQPAIGAKGEADFSGLVSSQVGQEGSSRYDGLPDKDRAIAQFFEDMQKRLGVQPEQLVDAISQLSTEDLMAPARDTAVQFIENLDLEPAEERFALSSYLNMLNQIDEAEDGRAIEEKPFKLALTLDERLKDRELYEVEQKQRIEKLNDDIQKVSRQVFYAGF